MSRGPGTVVTELGVENEDYPDTYFHDPEIHHPCKLRKCVKVSGYPNTNFNVFVIIEPCSHPDCMRERLLGRQC